MRRASGGWGAALALIAASWAASGGEARAQASARTPVQAGVASPLSNPYMNPYTNPFMNPYATQFPMSGRDAALSFMAAQQAAGGIGSGRLSGVRPAPSAGVAPAVGRSRAGTSVPGASAARYFQRTLPAGGGSPHYGRPSSYYRDFRR